jgi:ABC-type glycerol-3-phosphate transport system substrate-binding protein
MKTVRACVATALMAALLTGCGTSTNGAASAGETSGADTVVLDVWYPVG